MTENTNKLRAVFLTALMIGSVMVAGIAFTGTAAAGPTTSLDSSSVSPNTVDVRSQNSYDIELNLTDVNTTDGTSDAWANVSLPAAFDGSSISITNEAVEGGQLDSSSSTNVSSSENGESVNITWDDGSGTISSNETVTVSFTVDQLEAPDSTGTDDVTLNGVDVNADGSTEASGDTIGSITVEATSAPAYTDSNFDSPTAINDSLVYAGQVFGIDTSGQSVSSSDGLQLRQVTDSGSSVVRGNSTFDGNWLSFDTTDLETGDYFLRGGNFDRSNSQFEIVEQEVTAEFDNETAGNAGDNTLSDLTVESPVRSDYLGLIHISDFDEEDYAEAFSHIAEGAEADELGSEGIVEDEDGVLYAVPGGNGDLDQTHELDFEDIDAGNYTATAIVLDTGVTATSEVTVDNVGDGAANFGADSFETTRGDFAVITVNLDNTEEATVNVGSTDVGYLSELDVTDGNDDGVVAIAMNTYRAGTVGEDEPAVYFNALDNDDTVTHVDRVAPSAGENLSNPLASTDYTVNVTVDGEETDVTTLFLNERSTTGAQSSVAPSAADTEEAPEIMDAETERDNVALGDKAVIQFDATGIHGYVGSGYNLSAGSSDAQMHGVYVTLEETAASAPANGQPNALNVSNASHVYDAANDSFYVVVDTDTFEDEDLDEGDEYRATLVVNETNPYVTDTTAASVQMETVNATFEVEEATASFDGLNDDDVLAVPPQSEVQVTGDTNLAPGSEVTIRARSTVRGNSFAKAPSVVVQEDGSINATYDFSGYEEDVEFGWTIRSAGFGDLTSTDGLITSDAGETETTTEDQDTTTEDQDTTTEDQDTTTEDQDTTTEDQDTTTEEPDDTTEDDGSGGGIPGFGIGVALVALLGAALLALRE